MRLIDADKLKSIYKIIPFWDNRIRTEDLFETIDNQPTIENLDYATLMQKLEKYKELEERLIVEYGSNATIEDLINLHFKCIELQDGEPLAGFRILTNDDAKLYDEWKLSKSE